MARVAVVTGASSGIGKEAAKTLAAQGWTVIATGRDPGRSEAAQAALREAAGTGGGTVHMIRADLSLLAEAARTAREIAALTDRIDVLINNAGGMAAERSVTVEGLEANFAGNHLGPFLLTERLTPLLRRAAAEAPRGSVRIVNTSSNASEMIDAVPVDDMPTFEGADAGLLYRAGKLANVLHARGLAARLGGDGIVVHALHPGVVASNFVAHVNERTRAYMATLDAISPEQSAEALVWLATSDDAGDSGYWHGKDRHPGNPVADDPAQVERLWRASERLTAHVA